MDKFAKRLQSRLTAKGYRFNKEECRQALVQVSLSPLEPSEEEMVLAFDRLVASIEIPEEIQAITPIQTEEISQALEPEAEINIPTPENFDIPVEDLPCLQPPEPEKSEESSLTVTDSSQSDPSSAISQLKVTQAVDQAIAQLGATGNQEAVDILSSLAQELMAEISDIEEMTSTLITAYLNKRGNILTSAIGTINNLRSAQSNSFQSGRNDDFFAQKAQNKQKFLSQVQTTFN
ncbi:hypothetical protein [Allocoleopsis franciscana]|uniref:Uncharacterized protein n=1 Tax=Allocoleopsis franciscana PCC 7113 TaxID=1173027 RepID=K9WRH2_9CYAN|nr:hypothetical protein [Allocoleopsis franciscana]AFZ22386.1 hypothetical protein Mic7113_6829 [Allocoleopsis franciscana PCC 7113]